MFPVPPLFKLIQEQSGTPWEEMYKVFNMGHRMEVYCKKSDAKKVVEIAESFGIAAQVVGYTEKSARADGKNHASIKYGSKKIEYGPRD